MTPNSFGRARGCVRCGLGKGSRSGSRLQNGSRVLQGVVGSGLGGKGLQGRDESGGLVEWLRAEIPLDSLLESVSRIVLSYGYDYFTLGGSKEFLLD